METATERCSSKTVIPELIITAKRVKVGLLPSKKMLYRR